MAKDILKLSHEADAGNAIAARVILADPERYAGVQVAWARLWKEKHGEEEKEKAA